jgi:hypothetical protein
MFVCVRYLALEKRCQVSGVSVQVWQFLTPETRLRGFRSKINKLIRKNHFNKSVILLKPEHSNLTIELNNQQS